MVLGIAAMLIQHFVIAIPADKRRAAILVQIAGLVGEIRGKGVDEQRMRLFVVHHAGQRWPVLFGPLFGWDSIQPTRQAALEIHADQMLEGDGGLMHRWMGWIDHRIEIGRRRRDRTTIQTTTMADLQSQGVDEQAARRQSYEIAAALMDVSRQIADGATQDSDIDASKLAAAAKRQRIRAMLADARSGRYATTPRGYAWSWLLCEPLRFVAALCCAGVFAWWVVENPPQSVFRAAPVATDSTNDLQIDEPAILPRRGARAAGETISSDAATLDTPSDSDDLANGNDQATDTDATVREDATKSADPSSAAATLAAELMSGDPTVLATHAWLFAVSAMLLLASTLVSGMRMTLMAVPMVAFTLYGMHLPIPWPEISSATPAAYSAMMGLVCLMMGYVVGEPDDDQVIVRGRGSVPSGR
ncbi:MAG: hypothetical protein AAFN70_14430 [Planctomycetota bacterium]